MKTFLALASILAFAVLSSACQTTAKKEKCCGHCAAASK